MKGRECKMTEIILRIVFFIIGCFAGGIVTFIMTALCIASKSFEDDANITFEKMVRDRNSRDGEGEEESNDGI